MCCLGSRLGPFVTGPLQMGGGGGGGWQEDG